MQRKAPPQEALHYSDWILGIYDKLVRRKWEKLRFLRAELGDYGLHQRNEKAFSPGYRLFIKRAFLLKTIIRGAAVVNYYTSNEIGSGDSSGLLAGMRKGGITDGMFVAPRLCFGKVVLS